MINSRQQTILTIISDQTQVSVEQLLLETKASSATIRRDLQVLEKAGRIERFHGGARLSLRNFYELSFERRAKSNIEQKKYIADIAVDFIDEGDNIILGAGTTTLYVARALAQQEKEVSIITNNLIIVQEAANFPSLKLTLLGGVLDYENMESIGSATLTTLQQHIVDKAFISVNALDVKHGALTIFEQNALLYRTMIDVSRKNFVLSDSSKFSKKATHVAVTMSQLDHLITDAAIDQDSAAAFEKHCQVHSGKMKQTKSTKR